MTEARTTIGRPKPVHGFASLTEAVIALRAQDVPFDEISRLTGSPETSLRTLAARARPHGKARLSIPGDVTRALQPFAEARGLTVSELAAEILRAALAAGVDRMLDDGEAAQ
jgi:hypothetical protein